MNSFQDLKDKYIFHSQKQIERAKKASRSSKLVEIAQSSNVKLVALQNALKVKMDEKKKEKYEKRLMMYKIANEEEEASYEKFFDENESECEFNDDEEQQQTKDEPMDEKSDVEQEDENTKSSQQEDDEHKSSDDDESEQSDEECLDEEQSMDCTPTNLIDENRDLVTKMMFKTQQSQLDNEGLLGLCSAKVASNKFIDDECDEDDDSLPDDRFDADDESDLNDEEIENETDDKDELDEDESDKELDDDELNKEPDEDESNGGLIASEATDQREENKEDGDQFDIMANLDSQDSQFENRRESTFLESRSDVGKPRFNLKEFIEDQAELSDEDKEKFSSDEEEDSNDEYEQDEIDENLPSEQEILKVNNKMFL